MFDRLSVLLSSLLPSQTDKGRKALRYRSETCLNCEHPLDKSDRYCPNCSQLNSTRKLHLGDFFREFFAGILAYDGRLMRSLRTMLFRPGVISKEYVSGKRLSYANPFRFYLSVSILFFILMGLLSKIETLKGGSGGETKIHTPKVITGSNLDNKALLDSIINETNEELRRDSIGKSWTFNVDKNVTPGVHIETTPRKKSDSLSPFEYPTQAELAALPRGERISRKFEAYHDYHETHPKKSPAHALEAMGYERSHANLWLYKKVMDYRFFEQNPDFAKQYFLGKLPIVIFFFIPVFTFCIKLLYIRKNRFSYMEHLTFAFHVQSLLFVLMIFALLFNFLFGTSLFISLFLLVFCGYLYKAMRRFYEQGRFKTLVKFFMLNTLFTILAVVATVVYVFLSFSLY